MPINILSVDVPLPYCRDIYVLGTGPNGVAHYKRIPKDACIIGVNKAVLLHGGTPNEQPHDIVERMKVAKAASAEDVRLPMWIWLCDDVTLPTKAWFLRQAHLLINCDFSIRDHGNPTPVFGTSPDADLSLHKRFPGVPYYFKYGKHLSHTPAFVPLYGGLRGGASIGAQAVQLAYFMGASRIVLCGIDMSGDSYFDKTVNDVKHMYEDGTSRYLPLFNGLVRWIKGETLIGDDINYTRRRVDVVSLSPTKLDVEEI